jgi:hypothetical protein
VWRGAPAGCVELNRQSAKILRTSRRNDEARAMQKSLQPKRFNDYSEQLAEERSETERAFLLKVLARKEAENRHRTVRGLIATTGRTETNG